MSIEINGFTIEDVCEISLAGADKTTIDAEAAGRRLMTKINQYSNLLTMKYQHFPNNIVIECHPRHRGCLGPVIMNADMWNYMGLKLGKSDEYGDGIRVTISWDDPNLTANAITTMFKFVNPSTE